MKVIQYNPEFKNKWNDFLINSKNATFLFNRNFVEYHADRFNDHSLMIVDEDGSLLAVLPANIPSENILVSHQGLTYGGLVVKQDEKLNNVIQYFREIMYHLHNKGISTLL